MNINVVSNVLSYLSHVVTLFHIFNIAMYIIS
jgi:hypothetical protein